MCHSMPQGHLLGRREEEEEEEQTLVHRGSWMLKKGLRPHCASHCQLHDDDVTFNK